MYNEDYEDYRNPSSREERLERTIDMSQEFLSKLIKNLYGNDVLNIDEMEDCLIELCDKLDVDFPINGLLPVVRCNGKNILGGI